MQNEKSQNEILYIMIYFSKIRTNFEIITCLMIFYLSHKNRAGLKYTANNITGKQLVQITIDK